MDRINRIDRFFGGSPRSALSTTKITAEKQAAVPAKRRVSARRNVRSRQDAVPLIESDGLFFDSICSVIDLHAASSAHIVSAVRQNFGSVWSAIPAYDRQLLLAYWRAPVEIWSASNPPATRRPAIRIVDERLARVQAVGHFGHTVNLPITAVVSGHDRLRLLIAEALAIVYRLATRQHWDLAEQLLFAPYEKWEASQFETVTEEDCEKKWSELSEVYMPAYRAEIGTILRRWNIADGKIGELMAER